MTANLCPCPKPTPTRPPIQYEAAPLYVQPDYVYYAPVPYAYYPYADAVVFIRNRYHHDHDDHHDDHHDDNHDHNFGPSLADRWDGQQQMRNIQAQRDWQAAEVQNMQSVQNQQAMQQSWANQQQQTQAMVPIAASRLATTATGARPNAKPESSSKPKPISYDGPTRAHVWQF